MAGNGEDELVGELGFVTTRIGGGDRAGEVQVPLQGGSATFIAYGAEPIARGAQVLVVDRRPGRVVDVMAFGS
jgi:hypothetical protein